MSLGGTNRPCGPHVAGPQFVRFWPTSVVERQSYITELKWERCSCTSVVVYGLAFPCKTFRSARNQCSSSVLTLYRGLCFMPSPALRSTAERL